MQQKEKCLESIHVHTGESLKRDLQDLAMLEGRAVGEYIRAALEAHVYGAKAKLLPFVPQDQTRSVP
jgi:hypothetical protein